MAAATRTAAASPHHSARRRRARSSGGGGPYPGSKPAGATSSEPVAGSAGCGWTWWTWSSTTVAAAASENVRQQLALVLERGDQLVGVGVARGRVLGERAQHHGVERRRHGGVQLARRTRRGGDLLEGDRDGRLALERHDAGEQLVEDHADRVEVGRGADGVALRLLGREVLGGAHDRARERHVGGARAGDAEVGDARASLLVEDHVVRLEVAVDDAAAVREACGAQDLHDDVDSAVCRLERRRPRARSPSASVRRRTPWRCSRCRSTRRGRRSRRCWGATARRRWRPRGGSARRTPGLRRSGGAGS